MSTSDSEVLREILSYLLQRPEGKDTFEGIARFWIPRQRIRESMRVVQGVLQELVAKGFLQERIVQASRERSKAIYYVLNQERAKEIQKLVSGEEAPPK